MRKVTIVVPVLITSCQVSEKSKIGPVIAQTMTMAAAAMNANGEPTISAVLYARLRKISFIEPLLIDDWMGARTGSCGIDCRRIVNFSLGRAKINYSISFRLCFARAAPIAVLTSFSSSGGGITAGKPMDSIHNSRVQPWVW